MEKNVKDEKVLSKKEVEQFRKDALNQINTEIKEELVNNVVTDVKRELDKVVKDVEESIDVEYKRELSESIKNELVDDIKNQIKKEESKLYRRKSWKIFRLNIYLLILIAFCGFLIYQLYQNDGLDFIKIDVLKKSTTTTTTTTQSVAHDQTWYINQYGYLMDNIHITDKSLLEGNVLVENINDAIKISMAYKLLSNEDITQDGIIYKVEKSKIDEAYKKLFVEDKEVPVTNFKVDNASFAFLSDVNCYVAVVSDYKKDLEIFNNILEIIEENGYINIVSLVGYKVEDNVYNINDLENPVIDNTSLSKVVYSFKNVNNAYILYSISNIE